MVGGYLTSVAGHLALMALILDRQARLQMDSNDTAACRRRLYLHWCSKRSYLNEVKSCLLTRRCIVTAVLTTISHTFLHPS